MDFELFISVAYRRNSYCSTGVNRSEWAQSDPFWTSRDLPQRRVGDCLWGLFWSGRGQVNVPIPCQVYNVNKRLKFNQSRTLPSLLSEDTIKLSVVSCRHLEIHFSRK